MGLSDEIKLSKEKWLRRRSNPPKSGEGAICVAPLNMYLTEFGGLEDSPKKLPRWNNWMAGVRIKPHRTLASHHEQRTFEPGDFVLLLEVKDLVTGATQIRVLYGDKMYYAVSMGTVSDYFAKADTEWTSK